MYKNKLLVVLMVLFSIVTFTLTACATQPSQQDMKEIIENIIDHKIQENFGGCRLDSIHWKEFKILNSFDKKIKGESWYCVKVQTAADVIVINPLTGEKVFHDPDVEILQFRFIKRGNEWYGAIGY